MTTQHTPVPWGVSDCSQNTLMGSILEVMIVAPPHEVILQAIENIKAEPERYRAGEWEGFTARRIAILADSHYTPIEVCRANAEFIVRACNAFYPMLSAIRGMESWLQGLRPNAGWNDDEALFLHQIRDIISTAEAPAQRKSLPGNG